MFTNCGQEGMYGPSQDQCNAAYSGGDLNGQVDLDGGVQNWVVPSNGNYTIEVCGAEGGHSIYGGGYGACMGADFELTANEVVSIVVGQQGGDENPANTTNHSGGGGGGGISQGKAIAIAMVFG